MHALILAVITPDNTPHGYNWTYAFPMLLFIVSALVLWGLFGRPHRRVPSRPLTLGLSSRARDAGTTKTASNGSTEQPPADGAGASQ